MLLWLSSDTVKQGISIKQYDANTLHLVVTCLLTDKGIHADDFAAYSINLLLRGILKLWRARCVRQGHQDKIFCSRINKTDQRGTIIGFHIGQGTVVVHKVVQTKFQGKQAVFWLIVFSQSHIRQIRADLLINAR
ncbi:Uncharacterised protein [Vibrio cholerae]|uniref:Uncharacterized protein n=1 Tax=Vibrio cholerae TaxID=666 RepID=A0A656A5L8_VIBCL|nr:Uncharacterised protein [Vibrio cholerae]